MTFPDRRVEIALVDAPLDIAVSDAQRWLRPSTVERHPFHPPVSRPDATMLACGYFWAPSSKPNGTALVANCSLAYNLAVRCSHRVIEIRVSPSLDEWPICELALYEHGELRRFVRAFRDDPSWEFYQRGEPLDFEDLEAYTRQRIRDRFTPEMLRSYCASLGWDIDPAVLIASQQEAALVTLTPKEPWTSKRYIPAGGSTDQVQHP